MDQEELERTTKMQTMLIELDEDSSIDDAIIEFQEKIEYLDRTEEQKEKLKKLCQDILEEENENTKDYLFKLLQKETY